jgi:putative AlgH/UPF0301 family transcriptional regulator
MEEAKSLQEEEEAAASESEGVMVTQNLLLGEWRAGRLWEAVRETSWAPMDSNKKEKVVDRGREGRWADLFCNPQTPRI